MMSGAVVRIGLIVAQNLAYCRSVLRGIKDFADGRPHWVLMPVAPQGPAIKALGRFRPDGVIAHVYSETVARSVSALGVPFVNVSGAMPAPPAPRVGTDDRRCGLLAAAHLLDRGFRHFAFTGHRNHFYSTLRETGFRLSIEEAGYRVDAYHQPHSGSFEPTGRLWSLDEHFQQWVLRLPRPVAIFGSNDIWGLQITEACRQLGLRVPEDVAIVGVDNDDLLCGLARPPLSSISVPGEQIGLRAAALLDRLLRGKPAPRAAVLLPPVAVIPRRSSDVLAIDDARVAAAVRYIRDHAHEPMQVGDVLAAVPISRRSLERRFREVLGRSLHDEIRRVHLEQAVRLLAESDLPVHVVAARSGFSDAKQLSVVFRQSLGATPSGFRREARGHAENWGGLPG